MFDYRIILICLMACVFLCLLSSMSQSDEMSTNVTSNKTTQSDTETMSDAEIESIPRIQIDKDTYEKMVDIVTDYSLKAKDHNEKMLLIYLSTFHLFDMNYGHMTLKKLDNKIEAYPYFPNNTQFPEGNMHHNLQKAIITHITLQIANSERQLVHDKEKDRVIIDIYLHNLFTGIKVM